MGKVTTDANSEYAFEGSIGNENAGIEWEGDKTIAGLNNDLSEIRPDLNIGGALGLIGGGKFNLSSSDGKSELKLSVAAGIAAGLGWAAMGLGVVALFERRPWSYLLINGGYLTVSFAAMGAILGAWR